LGGERKPLYWAGNPRANGSPDIVVNCWIKSALINGGESVISFID